MAEWCLITGIAPSEYKALNLRERARFKDVATELAQRRR